MLLLGDLNFPDYFLNQKVNAGIPKIYHAVIAYLKYLIYFQASFHRVRIKNELGCLPRFFYLLPERKFLWSLFYLIYALPPVFILLTGL